MSSFPLISIPLLPLLGAAVNLIFSHRPSRRRVHVIGVGAVAGSFVVSLVAIAKLWPSVWAAAPGAAAPRLTDVVFESWIAAGGLDVQLGLLCDPLSAVMLVVVTFVGLWIHVYSIGYMEHEPDYARFFGYLNLFTGAMLILVLADSLLLMFVGWEGVGLCSYLLIGFWYDKDGTQKLGLANAAAGRKAFIVNRIGDFGFLLGMFLLFSATNTLVFDQMAGQVSALTLEYKPLGLGPWTVASVAGALLFIGAMGKSAQIPLYVWLPDAMAGPTPVSALIHAATMVTAGVYMVARLNFLYALAPGVMGLIALIGALTALFAASIGFAQNDIKKVLAYSTVSQLGYMFVAVGVGAFSAGIFHLFTHAFFKACLFLCAGAVIHALHDEQDIRRMGGLRQRLKTTHWTFLVSTLAIAGIFPLSGFFSKDEILWKAISTGNPAFGPVWLPATIYVLGLAGALCTAFYMFRLYGLTFLGRSRLSDEQLADLHAPGRAMRWPLIVLASGAAVLGVIGLPELFGAAFGIEHINLFHHWLEPVLSQGPRLADSLEQIDRVAANPLAERHGLEAGLMLLSLVVAVGSSALAYRLYRQGPSAWVAALTRRIGWFYRLVLNKYWVDEIYDRALVRPFGWVARVLLFKLFDRGLIDGAVHLVAGVVDVLFGRLARWYQNGNLQHYVATLVIGLAAILIWIAQPPSDFRVTPGLEVAVGQRVEFDAGRDDVGDRRALEYRWDFDGDGSWDYPRPQEAGREAATTMPSASHIYREPGEYRVILGVYDARWRLRSSEDKTIRVVVPEADPKGKEGR